MTLYNCIVCNHTNNSVENLHNHHIQYHSLEELSHTIINLQGLNKHVTPRVLDDSNNNTCVNSQISDYDKETIASHDEKFCSLNCSQYIMWEHELNKRTEICDEDFYNIIEMLCNDLKARKHKSKKRKNDINTSIENKENFEHKICQKSKNETIETLSKDINTFNDYPSQVSTPIIACNNVQDTEHVIVNAAFSNEITILQTENPTNTENNNITPLALVKTKSEEKILTSDLLNSYFP
ncbi:uncharacterized protein LOC143183294 [Calliopsis andreniformis]|uniref:uncharacterized protein LOC143183294 n=1 Tax=Calliopsis andreniformis TaxID=337506 RepID=UPI003FCEAE1D